MKLSQLHKFIIEKGIHKDPRGKKEVSKLLEERKKKYEKLPLDEKNDYDKEILENPYSDSRILYGAPETEIKSIIVGIDIETPELLLADTLRKSGRRIDLALTHHPEGKAFATFYDVMHMHSDILNKCGVPINIAEAITDPRIKEVSRKVCPQNHTRAIDAARLLNIPFMCAHTPADNHVNEFLQELFKKKKPQKLDEVIKILRDLPEYRYAGKVASGPAILVGSPERKTGKIFVDMTGGTEGSIDAIEKLANSGIGTIVGMHMSEEHFKNSEKYHLNVIIAGHISSDNLGLNLLLDEVEKKFGKIDLTECSGFKRVRR